MQNQIEIDGKKYPVTLNMGTLARIAKTLEVKKFAELQTRLQEFNLPDMPLVVDALLKANGHADVAMEAIERMDPLAYFEQVIPAIFPKKEANGAADANPPTSQETAPATS